MTDKQNQTTQLLSAKQLAKMLEITIIGQIAKANSNRW
jgi:hypothetical protein